MSSSFEQAIQLQRKGSCRTKKNHQNLARVVGTIQLVKISFLFYPDSIFSPTNHNLLTDLNAYTYMRIHYAIYPNKTTINQIIKNETNQREIFLHFLSNQTKRIHTKTHIDQHETAANRSNEHEQSKLRNTCINKKRLQKLRISKFSSIFSAT